MAALKKQRKKCQTCLLLWDGITAVLGTKCRNVMTDVDIWSRYLDESGPLVISVRYHKVWSRRVQFYRLKDAVIPWPQIGFSPDVGVTGISESTIERALRWIEGCTSCDEAHPHCKRYDESISQLPKRVLLVGAQPEDGVKLYEPAEGAVGRYTALSHCWGEGRSITTTTENYGAHLDRIPSPLPQTFMDSVHVVRALGIQYLWIDSLCIIQNDDADWNDQAPQMAKIYGSAYCTISADAAKNTTAGFVAGSRRFQHTPKLIKYNFQGQEGTILARERGSPYPQQPLHDYNTIGYSVSGNLLKQCWSIARQCRNPGQMKWEWENRDRFWAKGAITHAPYSKLFSRAWVFQERMLSRRTLHFGDAETGWECRSLVDCECSPYRTTYGPMNTLQLSLKSMMDLYPWNNIVEHYAELDITKPTDRLVALSGLAKARRQVTGDKYLAGLWHEEIKGGLLWQVDSEKDSKQQQPSRLTIAPTWSWASVLAPVSYSFGAMRHNNGKHEGCCLDWELKGWTMMGFGMFAPSIQIKLRIEGLLLEVVIDDPQIEKTKWFSTTLYGIRAAEQKVSSAETQPSVRAQIAWDLADDKRSTYTLFVTSRDLDQALQGIILVPEEGLELQYKRCGMLHIRAFNEGREPWESWSKYMGTKTFHLL